MKHSKHGATIIDHTTTSAYYGFESTREWHNRRCREIRQLAS